VTRLTEEELTGAPRLGPLASVLLALLAVAVFLNGLGGDFTYDDKSIVRDNGRIESPSRAGEIFTTHYFGGSMATGTNYRPGILLSFALQRWVHGGRPVWFHAVNVALHAGVTLLLAAWLLRLRFPRGAVLAAAALFAVVVVLYDHAHALPSLSVAAVSRTTSFLAIVPVVLFAGGGVKVARSLRLTVAEAGALEILGLVFVTASVAVGPLAIAGVMISQFATFAVLLGMVFLRERPRPHQLFGVACTIAAVSVLAAR